MVARVASTAIRHARQRSPRVLALVEAIDLSGPARNLLQLADSSRQPASHADRIELTFAAFHRESHQEPSPQQSPFECAAAESGVVVRRIEERRRLDWRIVQSLRDLLRQERPDILETHGVKAHAVAALAIDRSATAWIAFHHGYTATDAKQRLYNQFDRWTLRRASLVVTVCHAFVGRLFAAGADPARVRVVHNSVDVSAVALRGMRGVPDPGLVSSTAGGERRIVCVGRLSYEKGHDLLFRALAQLQSAQVDAPWRLFVAGDGPERTALERLADVVGLRSSITFVGAVPDAIPLIATADLVVIPSRSEGSPNVLLEAMALARPVVAFAVGGVPEIAVNDQHALLAPAGDVRTFSKLAGRILNNGEIARRLGTAARERVRDSFTPRLRFEALLRIYREVALDKRTPVGARDGRE